MMYSAPIVCYVTDIWDWCLWNPFILHIVLCFIREELKTTSFNRSDIVDITKNITARRLVSFLSFLKTKTIYRRLLLRKEVQST